MAQTLQDIIKQGKIKKDSGRFTPNRKPDPEPITPIKPTFDEQFKQWKKDRGDKIISDNPDSPDIPKNDVKPTTDNTLTLKTSTVAPTLEPQENIIGKTAMEMYLDARNSEENGYQQIANFTKDIVELYPSMRKTQWVTQSIINPSAILVNNKADILPSELTDKKYNELVEPLRIDTDNTYANNLNAQAREKIAEIYMTHGETAAVKYRDDYLIPRNIELLKQNEYGLGTQLITGFAADFTDPSQQAVAIGIGAAVGSVVPVVGTGIGVVAGKTLQTLGAGGKAVNRVYKVWKNSRVAKVTVIGGIAGGIEGGVVVGGQSIFNPDIEKGDIAIAGVTGVFMGAIPSAGIEGFKQIRHKRKIVYTTKQLQNMQIEIRNLKITRPADSTAVDDDFDLTEKLLKKQQYDLINKNFATPQGGINYQITNQMVINSIDNEIAEGLRVGDGDKVSYLVKRKAELERKPHLLFEVSEKNIGDLNKYNVVTDTLIAGNVAENDREMLRLLDNLDAYIDKNIAELDKRVNIDDPDKIKKRVNNLINAEYNQRIFDISDVVVPTKKTIDNTYGKGVYDMVKNKHGDTGLKLLSIVDTDNVKLAMRISKGGGKINNYFETGKYDNNTLGNMIDELVANYKNKRADFKPNERAKRRILQYGVTIPTYKKLAKKGRLQVSRATMKIKGLTDEKIDELFKINDKAVIKQNKKNMEKLAKAMDHTVKMDKQERLKTVTQDDNINDILVNDFEIQNTPEAKRDFKKMLEQATDTCAID